MSICEILRHFDHYLHADHGLRLDAVVTDGAALELLGIRSQATSACTILLPEIPKEVLKAARSFAADVRHKSVNLSHDWLSNEQLPLVNHLQPRWEERLQTVFLGSAIHLSCLGRNDFLCAKLFAFCDHGRDLGDCFALAPSSSDLENLLPWLEEQHANPFWPMHVRTILAYLETILCRSDLESQRNPSGPMLT